MDNQQSQDPKQERAQFLQRWKMHLSKLRDASKGRFKVDRYIDLIPEMLTDCYRFQVERRGHTFNEDTATAEHIRKAAEWLVGKSEKPGFVPFWETGERKNDLSGRDKAANRHALLFQLFQRKEASTKNSRIPIGGFSKG